MMHVHASIRLNGLLFFTKKFRRVLSVSLLPPHIYAKKILYWQKKHLYLSETTNRALVVRGNAKSWTNWCFLKFKSCIKPKVNASGSPSSFVWCKTPDSKLTVFLTYHHDILLLTRIACIFM